MKTRVPRLVVVALTVAVGVILWRYVHVDEPELAYRGKHLRVWLDQYAMAPRSSESERAEASLAVRKIGTNAIPTLLKMLRKQDSTLRTRLSQLDQRRFPIRFHLKLAASEHYLAACGFEILGADARDAVPALIGIFEERLSDDSQFSASRALTRIGPEAKMAIPCLLKAATNSDIAVRYHGVYGLSFMHSEPEVLLPILVKFLSDTNKGVRVYASKGIASFGPAARQVVPNLTLLLNSDDPEVRRQARWTLIQIDPEAAANAGVK